MDELLHKIVQYYSEKDFTKCKNTLLHLALTCNANINEGNSYNHDIKRLLFAVDFIKNPLGVKYSLDDYNNISSILLSTLRLLEKINDPKFDTSSIFRKGLKIDRKIIDDLIDLVTYTHVLHQMNQINSKRMDDCETCKLPFVEQMLTTLTFFQDQIRLLRQNSQTYLHDDYITGMEFAVADRPVEYCENSTSSISDSLESTLEAINQIIRYLYYQHGKSLQSQVQSGTINFELIHPYQNADFQQYLYIATQRHLLHRIEEGIRYGYYTFVSTGIQDNGIRYFQFSLQNEDNYRARRLGILRREHQYQQHGLINALNQDELTEAYEELKRQADILINLQMAETMMLDVGQFHPNKALFKKAEETISPKLRIVEQLTKDHYLECQVKDVKICDLLCAYRYLSTLAGILYAASSQLIDQDVPRTYIKEICLVNTSYLSSELSRIHDYSFEYAEKLIDRFVFHERSNKYDDIFAQPLLKISDTQVVLSQALLEQVNIDRAIERQFIRFEKNISEVGFDFEKHFADSLTRGYSQSILNPQRKKIPNFEQNINKIKFVAFDGKDIEFDVIAKLGDYIILTELKSIMSSYDLADLETRKKNIKVAIDQLKRRAESLIYDWDTIRSMVSIHLPEKPVARDHIILVACTDSYDYTPLKEGDIFITDESSYLKYFTNPYVQAIKTEKNAATVITVKELWSNGYPDATEFMEYLLDPVTIHPLADCLVKISIPGIVMDKQDFWLIYEDYSLSQDPIRSTGLGSID